MSASLKFCGRSQELETLKERWRLASNIVDPCPQVVIIKAGRGIGKTRLALEFYRWLSEENNDPESYWPDALEIIDRNLEINPDPEKCHFKKRIPHLWWGLRASDTQMENRVGGDAVATYDRYLALHLVTLVIRANCLRTGKQLVSVYAEIFGEEIVNNVPELLGTAIPYFGLAVGLGKALYKTIRIGSEGYLQGKLDTAREKPQSRTEAVLSDLERVFNPEGISFAKTAGVILIDDAQFAANDATLLEFSDKLIRAAMTQKWPLMIIATHWRDEYQKGDSDANSFVGMIRRARDHDSEDAAKPVAELRGGHLHDEHYCEMDLWAVDDLSDALKEQLPGLEPDQAKAILDRAGGNPRFLEQMIKLLLENERYFEDLDVSMPLTTKGLSEALEKTTNIFDVVMERLRGAPPEVQEAICLASVQGIRFSSSIAEEFAQAALRKSLRDPLAKAENPYDMVVGATRTESEAVSEFVERLFYEVAAKRRQNIKGLHDEAALEATLKQLLTARLDDPTFEEKAHIDDRAMTYRLAASVFKKSKDSKDTSRALHALARLAELENSRRSFEVAVEAAELFAQLAAESRQSVMNRYSGDFLSIIEILGRAGSLDRGLIVLDFLLPPVLEMAPNPHLSNEDLALCFGTLGCAGNLMTRRGALQEAECHFEQALHVIRELARRDNSSDSRTNLARQLRVAGHLAGKRGDLEKMEQYCEESFAICRDLAERLNTPTALQDLADALNSLGSLESSRGNSQRAVECYEESLTIQRGLAKRLGTPESMLELASTLNLVGSLAWASGDHKEADRRWEESLAILRNLAKLLNTPETLFELAKLLCNTGVLQQFLGNQSKAAGRYEESLAIYRDLVQRLNTPDALEGFGLALRNSGVLESERGNNQKAAELYGESLSICRHLAGRINTPDSLNDLSKTLNNAGLLAMSGEDHLAADKYFKEGLEIQRDLVEHWNSPDAREVLATILFNSGRLAYACGAYQLAAEHYDECLDIRRELAEQLKTSAALTNLSRTLANAGNIAAMQWNYPAAIELCRENVSILRNLAAGFAPKNIEAILSGALLLLTDASVKNGDFATALACVTEGRAIAVALPEETGRELVLKFDALREEIEETKS